jgi:hypothetical protein
MAVQELASHTPVVARRPLNAFAARNEEPTLYAEHRSFSRA